MSDMTHYHGDTCDPPHPDPLAEALWDAAGKIDDNDPEWMWDRIARVARERIAAEIEADMDGVNWAKIFRNGMAWAASIARRETGSE